MMRTIRKALMLGVAVAAITACADAEDLFVPAKNSVVKMSSTLISDQWYVIEARGAYYYKGADLDKMADAEWVRSYVGGAWTWVETPGGDDLDLYVDGADISMMGTEDGGQTFLHHVYSPDHVYRAKVLGQGVPIELSIYDTNPGDNSGGLSVTILPAVMGDTNVNGVVDGHDYRNLVAQFGGPPGDESADFNGDGVVDLHDFCILRENFDPGPASAPTGESGATAPEPATLILMVSGLPLLMKRRRLGLAARSSTARTSC